MLIWMMQCCGNICCNEHGSICGNNRGNNCGNNCGKFMIKFIDGSCGGCGSVTNELMFCSICISFIIISNNGSNLYNSFNNFFLYSLKNGKIGII